MLTRSHPNAYTLPETWRLRDTSEANLHKQPWLAREFPVLMFTKLEVLQFLSESLPVAALKGQVDILENHKLDIADATTKCVITSQSGDRYFMLVSGQGNPRLVARAVGNIQEIRRRLPARLATNVLAPIASGNIVGRTCAVWPSHLPFYTSNRLLLSSRKLRYVRTFLDWTHDVCATSLSGVLTHSEVESRFLAPLWSLLANPVFPARMHNHAKLAIERIMDDSWRPIHCAQHGDLWMGNFLLPSNDSTSVKFYVIDWAGATLQGFPLFDLTRLAISLRVSTRVAKECMSRFSNTLSCEQDDLLSYVLCAIGELGTRLEHFPTERYLDMSVKLFDFVAATRSKT
jgi:hypothetical protein